MSIIVVCPGCLKSFKVSDKFAGKSGPCRNCKRILQVPTKETEVKVHAPEAFAGGGKSAAGKLITKPIARVNAKLRPVTTAILIAAVTVVLVVTWIGGQAGWFDGMIEHHMEEPLLGPEVLKDGTLGNAQLLHHPVDAGLPKTVAGEFIHGGVENSLLLVAFEVLVSLARNH